MSLVLKIFAIVIPSVSLLLVASVICSQLTRGIAGHINWYALCVAVLLSSYPLLITICLAIVSPKYWAIQCPLLISTILYDIIFFCNLLFVHFYPDPQAPLFILFVGNKSLPYTLLLWITSASMFFFHQIRQQREQKI